MSKPILFTQGDRTIVTKNPALMQLSGMITHSLRYTLRDIPQFLLDERNQQFLEQLKIYIICEKDDIKDVIELLLEEGVKGTEYDYCCLGQIAKWWEGVEENIVLFALDDYSSTGIAVIREEEGNYYAQAFSYSGSIPLSTTITIHTECPFTPTYAGYFEVKTDKE